MDIILLIILTISHPLPSGVGYENPKAVTVVTAKPIYNLNYCKELQDSFNLEHESDVFVSPTGDRLQLVAVCQGEF
jgi:hypothetical protein